MAEQHSQSTIVVGVDGSEGSANALRWAADLAATTGAEIRAVMAWEMPVTFGFAPSYEDIDWAENARQAVDQTVASVMGPNPSVAVSTQVVHGHAAHILVEASRDADLLVVGSRGHGTVMGMLLGSISQHCVQHAECPVVVVRPPAPKRENGHGTA